MITSKVRPSSGNQKIAPLWMDQARLIAAKAGRRAQRLGWKVEDNPVKSAAVGAGVLTLLGLALLVNGRRKAALGASR